MTGCDERTVVRVTGVRPGDEEGAVTDVDESASSVDAVECLDVLAWLLVVAAVVVVVCLFTADWLLLDTGVVLDPATDKVLGIGRGMVGSNWRESTSNGR